MPLSSGGLHVWRCAVRRCTVLHCIVCLRKKARRVQPRPRRGWLVLLPGSRLCQLSVQPLSFSLLVAFSFAFSSTVRRSNPTTRQPSIPIAPLETSPCPACLPSSRALPVFERLLLLCLGQLLFIPPIHRLCLASFCSHRRSWNRSTSFSPWNLSSSSATPCRYRNWISSSRTMFSNRA